MPRIGGLGLLMREDGYVTASEVARATGKNLATIHRAIHDGRMPGARVGTGWFVDIHKLLASQEYAEEGPAKTVRAHLLELAKLVKRAADGAPPKAPTRTPRRGSAPRVAS